jgi:hypothetical protein
MILFGEILSRFSLFDNESFRNQWKRSIAGQDQRLIIGFYLHSIICSKNVLLSIYSKALPV